MNKTSIPGYWRPHAAKIIAEVINRVGRGDMKALKKAIREAYPFGQRKHHPYKIWCSEVRAQLYGDTGQRAEVLPGQKGLFDESEHPTNRRKDP